MLGAIAKAFFGSENDRVLKKMQARVDAINALEQSLQGLDDESLKERTNWFKSRLADGETIDDLLVEAFATVREAAKRILNQRHFDVQLLGGIVLHEGKIAEMKTGEGKTLVATLPVYLNALKGNGVHVVTVNDYLARRDSSWMGEIYEFLGLTVGVIVQDLSDEERQSAYAADVTYGTNNEFGFDYLRDNMKFRLDDMCQREFEFAIVDEVDSILIDEARTPLIISGPAEDSSEMYRDIDGLIPELTEADFEKDEKQKTVMLTEAGTERIEALLIERGIVPDGGMYDIQNISAVHHVNQALRAHKLFTRDVDYIVRNDMIVIIDEFTGRAMEGRRFSEGLHQALEAREGVTIQNENQTLASITFQNYFRLFPKLAGMTGTAMTEASEFAEIYSLDVVEMIDVFYPSKDNSKSHELKEFINDRLVNYLKDNGYSSQQVDAVAGVMPSKLHDIIDRLDAVKTFTAFDESDILAATNKRVTNILKKYDVNQNTKIDTKLFQETEENNLYEALNKTSKEISGALKVNNYTKALTMLIELKDPIDSFFEKIMVNAEDKDIRANRHNLLIQLHKEMNCVADISKLSS